MKKILFFAFIFVLCLSLTLQPQRILSSTFQLPKGFEGYNKIRITPEGLAPTLQDTGAFRVSCKFSHMNYDDAILFPNAPGKSHLHTYFGNTGTNASSTYKSLMNTGNSTCDGGIANRSAYWVPTILNSKNQPIAPSYAIFYYKGGGAKPKNIKPMPAGLRLIAGDSSRTISNNPTNQDRVWWGCKNNTGGIGHIPTIPTTCLINDEIELMVFFPRCWNGKDLDSPDHKRHMSYTIRAPKIIDANGISQHDQACPLTHPIMLPDISAHIFWVVTKQNQKDIPFWHLSSDMYKAGKGQGGMSAHGDWFGAWQPDVVKTWVKNCLNKSIDCHGNLLGNGKSLY